MTAAKPRKRSVAPKRQPESKIKMGTDCQCAADNMIALGTGNTGKQIFSCNRHNTVFSR